MVGDMYGDFSRLTFVPEKHFSAVLLQQGRVLLDADANEQTAILLHALRLSTADVLGPYAGPPGADANFQISLDTSTPPTKVLRIAGGRYYVHGLLCEADARDELFRATRRLLDEELESDRCQIRPTRLPEGVGAPDHGGGGSLDPRARTRRQRSRHGRPFQGRVAGAGDQRISSRLWKQITDWPPASVTTAKKEWTDWEAALASAEPPTAQGPCRVTAGPRS